MPRNRYARLVRARQCAQLAHQEKQLTQLIRQLRCRITEPSTVLPLTTEKDRRSARLAQKRLRKPVREDHTHCTPRIEGSIQHADH